MPSDQILRQDMQVLEKEIERHCIALRLECVDQNNVQLFVNDLFQNMEKLKKAARMGDHVAQAKMEIFSMAMMMHSTNNKLLGSNYIAQIDELIPSEGAWVVIAKAIWRELGNRHPTT
ncbi:MAG: hypothetical protein WCI39_00365 [Gallionellaceae bacterium]